MDVTKIVFIVNPISGTKTKDKIIRLIPCVFSEEHYKIEIFRTEYSGHGTQLARQLGREFDIVVAVGGDGTVNEVASGLIDTKAKLGIVPCGSGDGLARHLKIPQNPRSALLAIKAGVAHPIDVILFNNRVSVNLSGIGFDAVVAHNFAKSVRRGVFSYIRQVVLAYFYFKPFDAIIKANGQSYRRKSWLVAVANSSQFGNNAVISPISEVSDGKMEICILKPFSAIA
ncbi:MAG TPA: YegS/Rv2252/BmrU family lipid kinase, partial [Salinivirgaceae bacterium]|nr:YegS/Rv2252/BmrU family lipid kinase [Salinivirgaceae bacterium]